MQQKLPVVLFLGLFACSNNVSEYPGQYDDTDELDTSEDTPTDSHTETETGDESDASDGLDEEELEDPPPPEFQDRLALLGTDKGDDWYSVQGYDEFGAEIARITLRQRDGLFELMSEFYDGHFNTTVRVDSSFADCDRSMSFEDAILRAFVLKKALPSEGIPHCAEVLINLMGEMAALSVTLSSNEIAAEILRDAVCECVPTVQIPCEIIIKEEKDPTDE